MADHDDGDTRPAPDSSRDDRAGSADTHVSDLFLTDHLHRSRQLFALGQYDSAYRTLVMALHHAATARDVAGTRAVADVAREQAAWFGAHSPTLSPRLGGRVALSLPRLWNALVDDANSTRLVLLYARPDEAGAADEAAQ